MKDSWFFFVILPFWLLFSWAGLKIMWNVWTAKRSLSAIFFMDPALARAPENRKYFWIMCGCMVMMVIAGLVAMANGGIR